MSLKAIRFKYVEFIKNNWSVQSSLYFSRFADLTSLLFEKSGSRRNDEIRTPVSSFGSVLYIK